MHVMASNIVCFELDFFLCVYVQSVTVCVCCRSASKCYHMDVLPMCLAFCSHITLFSSVHNPACNYARAELSIQLDCMRIVCCSDTALLANSRWSGTAVGRCIDVGASVQRSASFVLSCW
jgi:hypothetical protein